MKKKRGPTPRLLTRGQVAAIFQVSPSTVTRWAEAGKLPATKTLGGHRRYDAQVVRALARKLSTNLYIDNPTASANQEADMTKTVIEVPAMYGDHHVLELRRVLLALPGVQAVNASSCFHAVEVQFDSAQLSIEQINTALDEAGYLAPLPVPVETELAVTQLPQAEREAIFRHTTACEQVQNVVSFAHPSSQHYPGPTLWPCPGVGRLSAPQAAPAGPSKEMSHA